MPSATDLGAILTAMVTPFDSDGAVRRGRHARASRAISSSTAPTAWSWPARPASRRRSTTPRSCGCSRPSWTRWATRATVVAGTGSNDTAHSVHLTQAGVGARRGRGAGRDALLQQAEPARAAWRTSSAVAAATDLPVMLYNIPARCVINLEPDLLVELWTDRQRRRASSRPTPTWTRRGGSSRTSELALYAGDDNLLRPVRRDRRRGRHHACPRTWPASR